MSNLKRVLKLLFDPSSQVRRPRRGSVSDPPCAPRPPRDPEPVRPPESECTTGPEPQIPVGAKRRRPAAR